jgi:exonuclease VII large subunit
VLVARVQLLLLEAYEQLEKDVGKEVDRALSQQREDFERLRRRNEFLEQHLQSERGGSHQLQEQHALLEQELQDAVQRNNEYEQGIYGLPQVRIPGWAPVCMARTHSITLLKSKCGNKMLTELAKWMSMSDQQVNCSCFAALLSLLFHHSLRSCTCALMRPIDGPCQLHARLPWSPAGGAVLTCC